MTDLVHISDRISEAQSLLTHQLSAKDVINALIAADVQQSQEIEDAAVQLRARLDIDSQSGVQLDLIGELVGQPRQGRQDAEYRPWLKARVRVNRSNGSPKDLYAVAYLVLGSGASIFLRQIPVGHVLEVAGAFPAPDHVAVQRILQEASSIAVPFFQQFALAAHDRFRVTSGSTPAAASDNGFNAGRLVDWIGPDQTPDPYANIAHMFGWRLVDCWDCRGADFNASDQVVRLVGYRSELGPFDPTGAGSPTFAPVRGSKRKGSATAITFRNQRALAVDRHGGVFEGAAAWTIGLHFVRGSDASDNVFEISADPAVEIGASAHRISVQLGSVSSFLTFYEAGTARSFALGAAAASTPISLVLTYDGAGNSAAWINGTKFTDSDTHLSVTNLQTLVFGQYVAGDNTTWDGCKLAIFDRALTDAEAALLTDLLDREFTDNAYY